MVNAVCRSYTPLNSGEEDRIQQMYNKVESVGGLVSMLQSVQVAFPDIVYVQLVISMC